MAASLDNRICQVLRGNLDNLPKQESSKVRIFLSSTFTDYQEERNYLMRETFPVLRSIFQNKGYEFQIADMRWGVRDDAQNDHQTTNICLKQVENFYNTSRGPYLAIFLGNKYGYRPYPNIIEESEFDVLYDEVDKFNTSLLDEWFLLDQNMVPAAYILQPITSKFPHYNDDSEENAELHETDKENWEAVNTLLTNIFREAASKAYQKGLVEKDTMHKYQRSVTEAEIDAGLLSKEDAEDRVFCFIREFKDFNLEDTKARRYTDVEGNDFDEETVELLKNLKEKAVPSKLPRENIHYCTIPWTPDGITRENETHREYLEKFGKLFEDMVMRQVKVTFESKENYGMAKSLYQEVLHHSTFGVQKVKTFSGREDLLKGIKKKVLTSSSDSEAGKEKEKMMEMKKEKMEQKKEVKEERKKMMIMQAMSKGQEDVDFDQISEELDNDDGASENHTKEKEMDSLSRHLGSMGIKFAMEEEETNPSEKLMEDLEMMPLEKFTHPLVLFGRSGCGKTALMAKLASEVDAWYSKPIVKIIRFLGTSPKSNNLKTLLLFLCKQIWYNYNLENQEDYDLEKDMAVLILYFHSLLRRIDSESKPLVIILDSLDQLDGSDNAYSMMWLPKTTPVNVSIIVSMLPMVPSINTANDSKSEDPPAPVMCLDNARKNLGDEGHFVEVPSLPNSTAEDIMKQWMENSNQKLTEEQIKLIFSYFEKEPQPLYLKLCHDQSKLWKSYTSASECLLGKTIQTAIEKLFSDLEIQHGHILVSRALGYLTAAKHGLTDTELEDILSLDDEVLQDTYLYHLPPDPSMIRLPPLLWQRIRGDLGEFLVEREADGSTVFNWYHRQFIQVARTRYVFTSKEYVQELHGMLADFFNGTWNGEPKPLELYKRKKGSYPNSHRQVQAQPNSFDDNRYNFRKLAELPFHLTLSGRTDDLQRLTLHDLDWLFTKSRAKGIQEVLNDLKFAKATFLHQGMTDDMEILKEIEQLYKILILRSDALWKDPSSLPVQLLGQLGMNKEPETPGLAKLLQECWTWCETTTSPIVTPTTRCLPYPEPSVKMSLNICIANLGDPSENERKCAVSENGQVLYAVDKQKQGLGDLLKVFDLTQENQLVRIVPLKGMDVKAISCVANKYLHLVLYLRRDKFDPNLNFKLYNENLVLPSGVKDDDQVRGVSPGGITAFVLHPTQGEDKKEDEQTSSIFSGKKKENVEPVLVNLVSGQRSAFPKETVEAITKNQVMHALFSADGKYLVVVVAEQGGVVIDVKSKRVVTRVLGKDKESFSFSRGAAEHHVAEQTTRILPNNKIVMSSPSYEQFVSLCDLQTGEKIFDFWRKGVDKYSWDKMDVNRAENLVVGASASSSIVNGNTKKDCVVWNLQTGKVHAVIPNRKGWFSWVGFCGPEDEYILCCHDYSKQIVDLWYIGTVEDPLPYPEAIHVMDLRSISQVVRYFSNVLDGSYFVTASVDNTVTFHNMKHIDQHCKKILPEKLEELRNKFADGGNQEELDELMGVVKTKPEDDKSDWGDEIVANDENQDNEGDDVINGELDGEAEKDGLLNNGDLDESEIAQDHDNELNLGEENLERGKSNADENGRDEQNGVVSDDQGQLGEESQGHETLEKSEHHEQTSDGTDDAAERSNTENGERDIEKGGSVNDEEQSLINDQQMPPGDQSEDTDMADTRMETVHEADESGDKDVSNKHDEINEGNDEEIAQKEDVQKDIGADINGVEDSVTNAKEDANTDVNEDAEANADTTANVNADVNGDANADVNEDTDVEKDAGAHTSADSAEEKVLDDAAAAVADDVNYDDDVDDDADNEEESKNDDQDLIESDEPLPEPGKARIKSTCLALTRDGKTAVVGTSDGWVVFFDLDTGKVVGHHKQGQNEVQVALATSSGKYVATAEKRTVIWNTGTWDKYFIITSQGSMYGGPPNPSDLAEAKDILVVAVAGMECFGYVWNLDTKQMIKKLPGLYGFSKVVITSDAKKVVTTFFDFPMVMNVEGDASEDQFNMAQIDTMMAGCSCLCLSPDDRLVLAGSTDGSVRVMEIATGKFIFRMQHLSSVKQAAFSPDGHYMITGGFRSILIWSTLDGSLITTLANHQEFIDCFCFSDDGKFLISGSIDKRIIVWDFLNHSSVTSFAAHCPVSLMKATNDLSTIVYCPENIDYVAIMHPNLALKKVLAGEKIEVPEIIQKAQALALSFTPGSTKKSTSKACNIL